ncbi:MAG TPA: ABC transporter transmembrane domain-containing protein, partial [Myxococcota bacterium]
MSESEQSPSSAAQIGATPPEKKSLKRLGILTRLLALLTPYKARFAIATVALFISSAAGLVYPQALRLVVDTGITPSALGRIDEIAFALVGVFIVQAALTWLRHYLMSWLGERVVADLRAQVFRRLLALPQSWFHERRSGEITGRLAADVAVVENIVGSQLSVSLRDVVSLFGGIVLLFYSNWSLTLIMLGVVPPIVIGVLLFGRRIRKMSKAVQDRFADTSAHVQESVAAISTVQSFVREAKEGDRYADGVERYFDESVHLASWRGAFMGALTLAGSLGISIIIYFGARQIIAGTLSAGELASFALYTITIAASLASLASLWSSLQSAAGATERLFQILDEEPGIRDPQAPKALPAGASIDFTGVDFAYPSRADEKVLHAVDLSIKEGELVAVVGRSGAGKSTLTAL